VTTPKLVAVAHRLIRDEAVSIMLMGAYTLAGTPLPARFSAITAIAASGLVGAAENGALAQHRPEAVGAAQVVHEGELVPHSSAERWPGSGHGRETR